LTKSAVNYHGIRNTGIDFDKNKQANDIIVKHNRLSPEERNKGNQSTTNFIPGSNLDPDFLNLFAK
jgi:hypothetical protein